MLYQVKEWDVNFENFKSRGFNSLTRVCVPNKQTGDGFTFILCQPDGLEIFGAWYLLVEALSLQPIPRDGYCTDTGKPDGSPWTAGLLARRWRCKEKQVQRMLDVITCPDVAWANSIRSVSGRYPVEHPKRHLDHNHNSYLNPVPPPPVAASGILNGGAIVAAWMEVIKARGLKYVLIGRDTSAAKELSKILKPDQVKPIFEQYLSDTGPWLTNQGHALYLLPGRINLYLNGGQSANTRAGASQHGYHSGTHGAEVRAIMEQRRIEAAAIATGDADSGKPGKIATAAVKDS